MSLFNVSQTIDSKARSTSEVPIKDHQFLIVTDSGDIFYDFDGNRIQLTDIIILEAESQRLAQSNPFNKFYFVKDTGSLWRYNNGQWTEWPYKQLNTSVSVVLRAFGWSPNMQQTVEIDGLKSDQNGIVFLAQDITETEYYAAAISDIRVSGQSTGSLTFTAFGDVPIVDIPFCVVLF